MLLNQDQDLLAQFAVVISQTLKITNFLAEDDADDGDGVLDEDEDDGDDEL